VSKIPQARKLACGLGTAEGAAMADRTTNEQATSNGSDEAGAQAAAGEVTRDLDELKGKLETAEQDRDQFLNLLQRSRADFENYQKRLQRELSQERRYAFGPLVLDLLPALDNLDRAMQAASKAKETGPLVQGVAMVQSQVLEMLKRHGITRIEAKGKPFDPNTHEAVMQQPSKGAAPGTILEVLEEGYMIHDRVLRPAKVVVALGESG
jgi:molecular chaperone GrpE